MDFHSPRDFVADLVERGARTVDLGMIVDFHSPRDSFAEVVPELAVPDQGRAEVVPELAGQVEQGRDKVGLELAGPFAVKCKFHKMDMVGSKDKADRFSHLNWRIDLKDH